ncbi:MAG: Crp/Fnr family transcriptional regulator [Desulfobacteraceae bacterium]|nr:MAG: Crp/Fnr family transcriptional regulator [Desulfobacteraceae bacterium]
MQFGQHLKEEDLFWGFPAEKQFFKSLSVRRSIRKGEFVFYEDDPGNSCFYLEEGIIKIFQITLTGKEPILMIRKTGEIFGLAEAFGKFPRRANAQAIRPCVLYEIDMESFDEFLSRHYPITSRIMSILGRRLRYLCEQVGNLMVCDVTTRLLRHLIYSCYPRLLSSDSWEHPITFSLDLTQEQIASMTGSCQQTVSETFKKLQEQGLIFVEGKEITLVNPLQIIQIAEQ